MTLTPRSASCVAFPPSGHVSESPRRPRHPYFPALEWEGVVVALALALTWLIEALASGDAEPAKAFLRMDSHAPLWLWSAVALSVALILAKGIHQRSRLARAAGNILLVGLLFLLGGLVLEGSGGQLRTGASVYFALAFMRAWVVYDNFLHFHANRPVIRKALHPHLAPSRVSHHASAPTPSFAPFLGDSAELFGGGSDDSEPALARAPSGSCGPGVIALPYRS